MPQAPVTYGKGPLLSNDDPHDIARKYDTVAYAAQSNALSHPIHMATVAVLFGLTPPPPSTCRVLEVGCSDGANLLPMAISLPDAKLVGCDLSGHAIGLAREAASELRIANVTLLQRDLAALTDDGGTFDYIIAHGIYSWVPAAVRDALLELASKRLTRNGVMFVSYNTFPGCHVRQAAWRILHRHVDEIAEPRARLDAARALAVLLAEPGVAQTETDGLLRQEFRKLATQTDSALFHDDLGVPNDPVYFGDFVAHLAKHDLTYLAESKVSMMTGAGLSPAVVQYVSTMDRLTREQYLDYARFRRFRQSLICHADAPIGGGHVEARVANMHVAASMALVRAAAEGKTFAGEAEPVDPNQRATRTMLRWLVSEAPRVASIADVIEWQRANAADDARVARSVGTLVAEAFYAGTVDLYVQPPPLASTAGVRPTASRYVRWQALRGATVTNLRHETLRMDDLAALQLLVLLDGTRSRDELAPLWLPAQWANQPEAARAQLDTALSHFAMHGLLIA